jgi:hypothetical protein
MRQVYTILDRSAGSDGVPSRQEIMEAALGYARRGWHVFPIKPDSKLPYTKWGKGGPGQRATTDEEIIRQWFLEIFTDASIGIACGPSGLLVVDEDPNNEGSLERLELLYDPLVPTLTATTPSGGRHVVYSVEPGEERSRNSAGRLSKGIDTRGVGGMIVAPPGPRRSWVNEDQPVAPAPEWLLEETKKKPKQTSVANRPIGGPRDDDTAPIRKGQRNSTLTSIAGRFRRFGLNGDQILDRLADVNHTRCTPQLDEDEVATIAESVAQYAEGPVPFTDVGNARRFVGQHQQDLRHCEALSEKTWFDYDSTRGLWAKRGHSVARRRAMRTVREMKVEAACIDNAEERNALLDWAERCESRMRISAMIELASAGLQVQPERLDAEWGLLLTPNGSPIGATSSLRSPLRPMTPGYAAWYGKASCGGRSRTPKCADTCSGPSVTPWSGARMRSASSSPTGRWTR